ncbi:MAG: ABC transporter permease [Pseudomonadota bacterium]
MDIISGALRLLFAGDAALYEIISLSLRVSVGATCVATIIGLPLGLCLALKPFVGRTVIIAVINGLMGLPPVVVGLCVFLALSRTGPFGVLGLLFTPGAMIIAQSLLILPIITALAHQTATQLCEEYAHYFRAHGFSLWQQVRCLLFEGRYFFATAVLAGLGRALAEVGAVMIVGGNIDHATRVMTSAIALEVSRGNLHFALSLGLVLVLLALAINVTVSLTQSWARSRFG